MEQAERTELTWNFEPADLFETAFDAERGGAKLSAWDGEAVVTVVGPQPSESEEEALETWLLNILRVRAMQTNRAAGLKGGRPRAIELKNGNRNIFVRVEPAVLRIFAGRVDFIHTDASGAVVRDTKAERIAGDRSEVGAIAEKATTNSVLGKMLESLVTALSEPAGEFVRLYEIRDALSTHFGGDREARNALGISAGDWSRFGFLANNTPVLEGRHRGEHPGGLRPATADERETMRRLAKEWIRKFAESLQL